METILTDETRKRLDVIENKKSLLSDRIRRLALSGTVEKIQIANRCKHDIVHIKLMHELKSYQNNFMKV